MEHTQIVTASELDTYAQTRHSEAVIPELLSLLIKESVSDLTTCRIPYGDAINQPGFDGLVETENGFGQFVPKKSSFWEIGTGENPGDKATEDFKKRTEKMTSQDRQNATFVFVTPRASSSGGWNEPSQRDWLSKRKDSGWHSIIILDGIKLADWLREFPAVGKWLMKKMGLVKTTTGFTIPTEHWENLQQLSNQQLNDPPLPAKVFLAGRDIAYKELLRLFRGEAKQLILAEESEHDAEDFIAAFLASLDTETCRLFSNKCLFVNDADTWLSMAHLKKAHVFLAHQRLDLESSGEQLHMEANKKNHAVIIPVSGALSSGSNVVVPLRSPSAHVLEVTLTEGGFKHERARELASAGALSLAALKRHLRGLGELPPYAKWKSARVLAQAGLLGRWAGGNSTDKAAVEILLGKSYGEWIEIVRPETLRSDTPLTQHNENWKIISRGEAWSALGPNLCNDDLDRFQKAVLSILGERDPKFDLPPEQRIVATIQGKVLGHSSSIRKGVAETLALLGSRPIALSSCSQGKAKAVAMLTVRELLKNADWKMWASLDSYLPMLAEAAPDEFLNALEAALSNPAESPFNAVFAQEQSGVMGCASMCGILWALETLAWHPDYLLQVTALLGELAAIDPGGSWSNRPANSLTDIFLPWHPQTCAPISKRKVALETLLRDHLAVGWKLLLSLLPNTHTVTSGCRKPMWREFITAGWSETVTKREYWDQVLVYAELVIAVTAVDLPKLVELIDHLPGLPEPACSRVLEHLFSTPVRALSESDRLPLWEALVDLAAKHRKYKAALWALPLEDIAKLEEITARLAPKSPSMIHRRLFSNRDFDLFEEKGNFEEQQRQLSLRRQAAVREILDALNLGGVLDFAQQVAEPEKVGLALGSLESNIEDTVLLPVYLEKLEKYLSGFIGGFVWGRFWMKSWPWVDSIITSAWTKEQKATFFALLPFGYEAWHRAELLLGSEAALYWKRARVNPWIPKEHLLEAVEKLLLNSRPQAALSCLAKLVGDKVSFPPNLAIQALTENLTKGEKSRELEQYAVYEVIELIKWLQNNPNANVAELCKIEFLYLQLLDRNSGGEPKTLEQQLAADPRSFCEVISLVFRSEKEPKTDQQLTKKEQNIALNAYRLLDVWKTVPGMMADGSFNVEAFNNWLTEVKQLCMQSGHLRIAMNQVGKVFTYAPPDPGGLWINRSVAEAINARDASEMLSGFTLNLFNRRGVYSYTAGEEEHALAKSYYEKANTLEQNGYTRFASAIRKVADSYKREAELAAKEDPFED